MTKAVMIISGGMDSGVLLSEVSKLHEVHGLTFNYGSNHASREIPMAQELSKKYCASHKIIELPFIKELFASSLLSGSAAIPEGHYEAESMKSTVVPFRNGIMLSIAAGYAESIGAEIIFIGNHAGDHFIYPDCRDEFIVAMDAAMKLGTFAQIRLLSPYCQLTKRDIGMRGNSNGFDFSITYSCYKGGEKHCGKCGSCTERKEALAGFDPTVYENI